MQRIHATIEHDGELHLTGLPFKKGESIDVQIDSLNPSAPEPRMTARKLRESVLGLWKNRTDIGDSLAYARQLREKSGARVIE